MAKFSASGSEAKGSKRCLLQTFDTASAWGIYPIFQGYCAIRITKAQQYKCFSHESRVVVAGLVFAACFKQLADETRFLLLQFGDLL